VLTPICDHAQEFIHALLPPWGEHHVYRTFAFGLAVAELAGWTTSPQSEELGWSRELWFLTAILHDIGWDAQDNLKSRLSFEIYGGIKAREMLMGWGASQEVADEVCEAIVRHTDGAATTGSLRLMTALTQIGAGHDLLGFAVPGYLHPDDNRIINARWPRLGFADQVTHYMENELQHKPGCITSKWAADILSGVHGVECYKGLEGEAGDDAEWKERRKTVVVDTYGYRFV
jgi:cyanamide hydratase